MVVREEATVGTGNLVHFLGAANAGVHGGEGVSDNGEYDRPGTDETDGDEIGLKAFDKGT